MSEPEITPTDILRRADAVTDGFTDAELARMVRRRELIRLQRGAYSQAPTVLPTDGAARHRLVVAATMRGLRAETVASHASAAAMHGLPVWGIELGRVHVLRRPPASGSGSARVHLHVARLPEHELTLVDGILTTNATRTVVDVARSELFESAVVVADHALASGHTSFGALLECLGRMGPVPGTRRAARVLRFASRFSESVGESRSRVLMHRLRLPTPDLQVHVLRADGSIVGRCDFGWRAHRTLGEFDGKVKYGRLVKPGQEPGDVVFQEKRREDELRDLRWQVVRWTWAELSQPRVLEQRLRRAFDRGSHA
ncbi:type IV toxin-antitoxin system AbiEi family antitoxin domain-containing protein [Blastococcus sp. CT_GayMR16]|uniref:type IV toxin-antitoxin system AbiEi family antitoxin domain-containing protein n=1 Tax=Blastococcus sp. CT_GayMR16 TaxID=2559607 RepID=UPI0010739678|nr:type IV toxin-antitoxin system AbiEi family antitoxin domain-containing protein [Blastococcus sp. CT_GayMR16]TFV83074.1 hypothetical protein E4P38_21335 [Blastococcus sp. CT_GayMR16]